MIGRQSQQAIQMPTTSSPLGEVITSLQPLLDMWFSSEADKEKKKAAMLQAQGPEELGMGNQMFPRVKGPMTSGTVSGSMGPQQVGAPMNIEAFLKLFGLA